jgi:type IV fimbrial biogenesis protein FimT
MRTPNAGTALQRGFSIIELMLAMCIVLTLVSITVPSISTLMRNYRRDAATQQIVGDVRKARSQAILTGWQYRVVGYNNGASSAFKNQYRLLARRSSAVSWPSTTAAAFSSSTQRAEAWTNLPSLYSGVRLNPSDATADFYVTFDSRGVRIETDSFGPLVVSTGTTASTTTTKSVVVSAIGGIRAQ